LICHDATLALGVYLLGALDPTERQEVEGHLATCTVCRAELDELAGLPTLLATITLEDLQPEPVTPSDELFDRVAARVRAEDEARARSPLTRPQRLLAAAAGLVLVAGAGVGGWAALRSHPHVYSSRSGQVQMQVTLADQTAGTELAVTVSGLATDEHCKLIAIAADGTRDVAGRWKATYDGEANVTGSTSIQRADLARLVLFGTDGSKLATVPV
jgi:anti-sigma factor RsiW